MKNKKIKILSLSLLGATALIVPSTINAVSCAATQNNAPNEIKDKTPITVVKNFSVNDFNSEWQNKLSWQANTSINKQFIIDNKTKLFSGNTDYLKSTNNINDLESTVKNGWLELKITFAPNSCVVNGELNKNPYKLAQPIIINGFKTTTQLQPKTVTNIELNLVGTAYKNASAKFNDIDAKNWVIAKKDLLFTGDTSLLVNISQIININPKVTGKTQVTLDINLSGSAYYSETSEINPNDSKIFSIIINGFAEPSKLVAKNTVNRVDLVDIDEFAASSKKYIMDNTNSWLLKNVDKLFSGTDSLLTENITSKIDIQVSLAKDGVSYFNTLNLKITLPASTYLDSNTGMPATQSKTFNLSINGFNETEALRSPFNSNHIDLSQFTFAGFGPSIPIKDSLQNVNRDRKAWVVNNLKQMLYGTTTLVNDKSDVLNVTIITSNSKFPSENGKSADTVSISFTLAPYTSFNEDGYLVDKPTEWQLILIYPEPQEL